MVVVRIAQHDLTHTHRAQSVLSTCPRASDGKSGALLWCGPVSDGRLAGLGRSTRAEDKSRNVWALVNVRALVNVSIACTGSSAAKPGCCDREGSSLVPTPASMPAALGALLAVLTRLPELPMRLSSCTTSEPKYVSLATSRSVSVSLRLRSRRSIKTRSAICRSAALKSRGVGSGAPFRRLQLGDLTSGLSSLPNGRFRRLSSTMHRQTLQSSASTAAVIPAMTIGSSSSRVMLQTTPDSSVPSAAVICRLPDASLVASAAIWNHKMMNLQNLANQVIFNSPP